MKTMKAYVRIDSQDDKIELQEMAIPKIDENEVLIEVQAFGVGIHDRYFIPQNISFPYIIGSEGAGIIKRCGANVSNFKIDDRVILSSSMQLKGGCWAEYVAVSIDKLVSMPDDMDFIHAAAMPVAGKTAIESMDTLDLKKGDTLFVAGASGAIGTLIIQLAKNKGAYVVGSASSKNHEQMLSLGAAKVVDYSKPDWKDQVRHWKPGGVDVALAIQPKTGQDSLDVVRDNGKVITVSGDSVESERNIIAKQFQHKLSIQQALDGLIKDIETDKIKLVLERVYSFNEALDALKKTETRHARGKLVVSFKKS